MRFWTEELKKVTERSKVPVRLRHGVGLAIPLSWNVVPRSWKAKPATRF